MKDLSHFRKSYEKSELIEGQVSDNPIVLFKKWFDEMEAVHGNDEVNAMTLSTIGLDNFPKSRIVLLKKFSEEGFTFFTNYNSEKGKAIAGNPNVSLSFFWGSLERQVIIKGTAQKTTAEISDNYFDSRPWGSKLGAIVSNQSTVIPSRDWLDQKLSSLELEYSGKQVNRPLHWGGYVVTPLEMEFWQGRTNRLHDRILYQHKSSSWIHCRLAP